MKSSDGRSIGGGHVVSPSYRSPVSSNNSGSLVSPFLKGTRSNALLHTCARKGKRGFPFLKPSHSLKGLGAAGFGPSVRSWPSCNAELSNWPLAHSGGRPPRRVVVVAPIRRDSFHQLKAGLPSNPSAARKIGAGGFEPPTFWSQTRRSTKLSHAPYDVITTQRAWRHCSSVVSRVQRTRPRHSVSTIIVPRCVDEPRPSC